MNLHLTLLLTYSALLALVGLWVGRRVRSASDFFVAGRRLGPVLLFSTLLAANLGAGSTVGAAGLGYRDGISAWWWVGSAGLGSLVLAFWIGPRIRRHAVRHDLRTVGDFLEHRYGRSVRAVIAVLLWFGTLTILAGQLIAIGFVLNVVAGIPPALGSLIGGIVMTVYFTAGGLLSAAWVNVVQLVVLLTGIVMAFPLALATAGGWNSVVATAQVTGDYWSFWGGSESGCLYLAMLGPAFIISPGLLQKVYGARDDRAVRIGVGANAVVLLLFAALPPLLGVIARSQYPGLMNHELALPTLLMHSLPPLAGGLALAALFSAELSSADAILFMLTTSLSQDLYRQFLNPAASDHRVLWVARWTAVAAGALGTGLALVAESIIGVLTIFYTLLTVSLFVPIIGGLYIRRVGTPEVLTSIAAGVGLVVILELTMGELGLTGARLAPFGLMAAVLGCGVILILQPWVRWPRWLRGEAA